MLANPTQSVNQSPLIIIWRCPVESSGSEEESPNFEEVVLHGSRRPDGGYGEGEKDEEAGFVMGRYRLEGVDEHLYI